MARPRKKPAAKVARKRDYKAEYARRVRGTKAGSRERQRARGHRLPLGVRSEYAQRVKGTEPSSAARRRASGHADGASALLRFIRPGTLIICDVRTVTIDEAKLRKFRVIPKLAIPSDRAEREFVLRGPGGNGYTVDELRDLIHREEARGAIFSPSPSLDQRRLLDY